MHEFTHVSPMMKDDRETFLKFVTDMVSKKDDFLKFTNSFLTDYEYKGVYINFYELDSDDYGYPVSKWSAEFVASDSNALHFRGYCLQLEYDLIHLESQNIVFSGDYFELSDYINSEEFAHISQDELEKTYKTIERTFDKCAAWLEGQFDIVCSFSPDSTHL